MAAWNVMPMSLILSIGLALGAFLAGCNAGPDEVRAQEEAETAKTAPKAPENNDAEGMVGDDTAGQVFDPERAKRIEWWEDARFGMFLCLDPFALIADHPKLDPPLSEQAMGVGWGDAGWHIAWGNITWDQTHQLADMFEIPDFDAEKVAKQIKATGVKYVNFTTKHCAGFSMFDTALSDWDIMNTPYGKDFLAELVPALRKEGIKIGFYFLQWDWSRPEYRGKPIDAPNLHNERGGIPYYQRDREGNIVRDDEGNPVILNEDWPEFLDFYYAQIEELLSNYGKIDVMWIDGWRIDNPRFQPERTIEMVRRLQPDCLLNDRFGDTARADFITPENYVPETNPGRPWETCYRSNGGWYYIDREYMSMRDIMRMLVDCVAKDGNLLLNFALNGQGAFDEKATERMNQIGEWMRINGEAIYGCGEAPLRTSPWGRTTYKPGHLYLHVYDDRHDATEPIVVEGIESDILGATLLDGGRTLKTERRDGNVLIHLPEGFEISTVDTIVDLQVKDPLQMAEKKFIRQWTVLEPFPAPQEGIRAVLGPESSLDTRKELMVGEADYAWTEIEACPDGFVNLNREFDASDQARISYAAVDVIAEKDMASEILIGSKNPAVVYVNGVMALRQGYNKEIKTARPDMKRAPIKLSRGRNTIVVKTQSAPEEWGFFAWIGGGSEVDFEPTESMAFIGSDPQSWAEAIAVIEAEDIADTNHTDLVPGRYASGDFIRMRPRENAARLCYAKAEFTLPEDAPNAVMMIRYGAALPVRVSTAVDDGEATVFALPVTGGYRNYKTVTVPLGALKAGEHTVTFRCVDSVAFHLDTFIIADGTPMGDGVRVSE